MWITNQEDYTNKASENVQNWIEKRLEMPAQLRELQVAVTGSNNWSENEQKNRDLRIKQDSMKNAYLPAQLNPQEKEVAEEDKMVY